MTVRLWLSSMIHPASLLVAAVTAASVVQAKHVHHHKVNSTMGNQEIVGGVEAKEGQHLYVTGLRGSATDDAQCGGSLIAPKAVLTAAHCITGRAKYVSVGSHFQNGADPKGERIAIERITKHPKYNSKTYDYDLAVIELQSPSKIKPIELLFDDNEFNKPGVLGKVRGWGDTIDGGNAGSPVLKEVGVKIWDNAKCNAALQKGDRSSSVVTARMLCAGGVKGEDSCQGDSGGPFTVVKNGQEVLAGVVSWGVGCALENSPGVYARLSQAKDFIQPFLRYKDQDKGGSGSDSDSDSGSQGLNNDSEESEEVDPVDPVDSEESEEVDPVDPVDSEESEEVDPVDSEESEDPVDPVDG